MPFREQPTCFAALPQTLHRIKRVPLLLCLTILLVLHPGPADATLRIQGGSLHASLWRNLYDRLPAVWKTHHIIYMQEVSRRKMMRLIDDLGGSRDSQESDDTEVDGCYQIGGDELDADGVISLRDNLSGDEAAMVFLHEYGHFVWINLLNPDQKKRYLSIWRVQLRSGRLVSDYSQESFEEGFAEAFAYSIRKPAMLQKRDPQSAAFFRTLSSEIKAHRP